MPSATYPYNSSATQPSLKQEQNVAIWREGHYRYHKVAFIEGLPEDSRGMQDLGAIAANLQTAMVQITVTDMQSNEIGEFRFRPLDDISLEAFLPSAQGRFITDNGLFRVTPFTGIFDPFWVSSTVWVWSNDRHLSLVAYNNRDYAIPKARVQFWGWRYICGKEITDRAEISAMQSLGISYFNAEGLTSAPENVTSNPVLAARR